MPGNPSCTIYIGNLDEKVNDRVLYEILIQAGRLVDMYIPRDKETNRPKGFAFAEYETEEIADYAVRLFSGLVTLYNRTLKFAISGQDRPTENSATPRTPGSNPLSIPRAQPAMQVRNNETFRQPPQLTPCRFSAHAQSVSPRYPQAAGPGLDSHGNRSDFRSDNFGYSRRVFGSELDSIRGYEAHFRRAGEHPVPYPSYR